MTKEKIIDVMQKHWHQDGYYTASFDGNSCADELLAEFEKEYEKLRILLCVKSDEAAYRAHNLVVLDEDIKRLEGQVKQLQLETENAKKEVAREIINKFDNKLTEKCLKSAEEQEYQQTARILKDVCPIKSHRVAKELAKEYEVEVE